MDETSATPLGPGVLSAWGRRDRPTKGPRPELTVERIVDAAVAVAEADGLGAVSMSRVATELGASTMALYRHVASKEELLELMVDAAHGPPPPVPVDAGWRPGLAAWARNMHAAYLARPWSLRVPTGAPPVTPHAVAWMEQGLACLAGAGLAQWERVATILAVAGYVRSDATLQADLTAAAAASGLSPDAAFAAWGARLAPLLDDRRFPELTALLTSEEPGAPGADNPEGDAEFLFGLDRLLDGIATHLRR
jgi:AcrR family transcriptional regulator